MGIRTQSGRSRVTRRAAVAEASAPPAEPGEGLMGSHGMVDACGEGGDAQTTEQTVATARTGEVCRIGYAPIVRVDATRREIELCATSEAIDSYGTIFSYEASKKAFERWIGNVREMHERKAIGRRVAVRFDDTARKVFVTIRISRGAQDTWEKVCDGTLRGASIGATNVTWEETLWRGADGKRPPSVAVAYDLVELSLVDHPSNPDALGFTFVRDAVPDVRLLDRLDAEPEVGRRYAEDAESDAEITEGNSEILGIPEGANLLDATGQVQAPIPEPRPDRGIGSERLHAAARAVMQSCGCILCEAAMASLAEENGPMTSDAMESDAMESDAEAETLRAREPGHHSRLREATLVRALQAGLRVSLASSARRLDALDARVCAVHDAVDETGAALRHVGAQVSQVADTVSETVARAMGSMGDLERRLEHLEAQPMPGGPAARAVEKQHPLHLRGQGRDQTGQPVSAQDQYRALEALAGRVTDPQAQIAVAAELIRLRREIG